MRVLIVGGTGYLGSKIAHQVKQNGHDLVVLVRTFLDQELDRNRVGLAQGLMGTVVAPDVSLTYIHSDDVARIAATALTTSGIEGERIDLGLNQPTTPRELAAELCQALGHQIEPQLSEGMTGDPDFDAFIAYMNTGQYVAEVEKQTHLFGTAPTLTDSVNRWIANTNQKGG